MEATDHSRSMRRTGPVWPQGKTLDDIRRRPSLTSRDGSVAITTGPSGTDLCARPMVPCTATWDGDASEWIVEVQAWARTRYGFAHCFAFNGATTWRFADPGSAAWFYLLWLPYYSVSPDDSEFYGSIVWAPEAAPFTVVSAVSGNEAEKWEVSSLCTWYDRNVNTLLGTMYLKADHTTEWVWSDDGALRRPFFPYASGLFPNILYANYSGAGCLTTEDVKGTGLAIPASTDSDVYWIGNAGTWPRTLSLSAPGAGEWGWKAFHIETASTGRLIRLAAEDQAFWTYGGYALPLVEGGKALGWSGSFTVAPYTYTVLNGVITNRT